MLLKIVPSWLKNVLRRGRDFLTWDPWVIRSWSQEGEDMVLRRIYERKKNGFYVDVGAHHPKRFSNTYLFYRRGWRGINIDAMPGSMTLFNRWRSRDINLEIGVGEKETTLNYYIFNDGALNGFSAELSEERNSKYNEYFVKEIKKIQVKPLRKILEENIKSQTIDFLSVDVEGLDLEVLRSNDWTKYRPKYVLAEILKNELNDFNQDSVVLFMRKQGYTVYAKQINTVFFEDLSQNNI